MRAASIYARKLGWHVVPLHDVSAGACSCPKGADCPSAGKHPRVTDWTKHATNDGETVAQWAEQWPRGNVGVATGRTFWVLDEDRPGAIDELEAAHGPLPGTVEQRTGSGGRHLLFTIPAGATIRNSASKIADGLDVRGEGGQIVIPPSVSSAGAYAWISGREPWAIAIADPPAWLVELATARPAASPGQPAAPQVRPLFPSASPEVLDGAREALAVHGPAVEGKGGDDHTFRAAAILAHDFALTFDEAWPVFWEWNTTCQPPWSAEQLAAKLRGGDRYGTRAYGCRRDVVEHVRALIAAWRESAPSESSVPTLLEPVRLAMSDRCNSDQRNVIAGLLQDATGWGPRKLNLPPAVDVAELAKRRQRAERLERGDSSVIDPDDPLRTARGILHESRDAEGLTDLLRFQGAWYIARGTFYEPQPDDPLRARFYASLERKIDVRTGAAFKPSRVDVETIEHAARAVAQVEIRSLPGFFDRQQGDPPPLECIALSNGILHVPGRRLLEPTRRFFTLNAVAFSYEPAAPAPREWLAMLRGIWGDDDEQIETLQELFGLLLTLDTSHQKAFLMLGPKRSGKGTIARVLTALVGSSNTAAPTLNGIGQHFGLEGLIGKQLAIVSDARLTAKTDLGALAENLLRVTGEDTLSVPRKHQVDWNGRLTTRFLVLSNELPGFLDSSGAIASRFIVLRLTNTFFGREDLGLTDRLLRELPGIFNWALDGLDRLRERGHFRQPASSLEVVRQLATLTSPTKSFVDDCCEIDPVASVPVGELFDAWCYWAAREGREHPGSAAIFGRNLSAAVPSVRVTQRRVNGGERQRFYEGIRLSRGVTRD